MSKTITKNDVAYVRTMQEVKASFGYNEFTRAEYKTMMVGRNVFGLDALVRNGLKVVRKEQFTVKLDKDHAHLQRVLKTDSGKILTDLKATDYMWASSNVKKALDSVFNNGNSLNIEFDFVTEIEGVRYFYAFDDEAFDKRVKKLKRCNKETVKSLDKRMAVLNKRIEICNEMTLLLDD